MERPLTPDSPVRTPAPRRDQPVPEREPRPADPNKVDEAGRDSFPASDPPAWGPLHPGAPGEHRDATD